MVLRFLIIGADHFFGGGSSTQSANIIDACKSTYSNALANISSRSRDSIRFRSLNEKMCRNQSVKDSFSLDVATETVLESFIDKIGVSLGSSRAKQEEFCQKYNSEEYVGEEASIFERTIVIDATSNLNACLELGKSGIKFTHAQDGAQVLTINVDLGNNVDDLTINAFNSTSNIECILPRGGFFSKSKRLSSDETYYIESDFSINCTRAVTEINGSKNFDRATVVVTTNRADIPYKVTMLEDSVLQPQFARESQRRIHDLIKEINSAQMELEEVLALKADLERQVANFAAYSGVIVGGQFPQLADQTNAEAPGKYRFLGCNMNVDGAVDAAAKDICRERQFSLDRVYYQGIGCGAAFYGVTCISR